MDRQNVSLSVLSVEDDARDVQEAVAHPPAALGSRVGSHRGAEREGGSMGVKTDLTKQHLSIIRSRIQVSPLNPQHV